MLNASNCENGLIKLMTVVNGMYLVNKYNRKGNYRIQNDVVDGLQRFTHICCVKTNGNGRGSKSGGTRTIFNKKNTIKLYIT